MNGDNTQNMLITFIMYPVMWFACAYQNHLQWKQSTHPKNIMTFIFNIIHISLRVLLETHSTRHPMSWCRDSVTLEVKTHDIEVVNLVTEGDSESATWKPSDRPSDRARANVVTRKQAPMEVTRQCETSDDEQEGSICVRCTSMCVHDPNAKRYALRQRDRELWATRNILSQTVSRSSPHKMYCMATKRRRSWAWPVW